jgi:hypothetical protein
VRLHGRPVGQLYKIDYRRYGVQIPVSMADEIDRLAKEQPPKSASTIIVEFLVKGMYGYGSCSREDMAQLLDDQSALMRAGPLALAVLYGDEEKRQVAATHLAELIGNSIKRKPTQVALVAEPMLLTSVGKDHTGKGAGDLPSLDSQAAAKARRLEQSAKSGPGGGASGRAKSKTERA